MEPTRIIARIAASLLVASVSLVSAAAVSAQTDVDRMKRDIELRVSTHQFMGSVLVAKGDRLLINQGHGSANLEWNIPNSPDTKFRLGSITKQFTATCILLLQERGKLKVETPIKEYLRDAPPAWDKITIFNLLTHTSGVPNYTSFPEYSTLKATARTPEQLVASFRDKPLEFEPGSQMRYSNSGYVLLGYLIEKIAGQGYAQFLKQNVFDPVGMRNTGYDSTTALIDHRASGYAPGPSGTVHADYIDMSVPFSAGGLYSTTGDLMRWERALFGGKVLSAASLEAMTTAFKDNYAFGLAVTTTPTGDKIISHGGGINGFNTELIYAKREDVVVAVLANLNGPAATEIATDLSKIARGEKTILISDRKPIRLQAGVFDRYAGHYQFSSGVMMSVWRDADRFLTQLPGQPAVEVFPESEQDFFAKVVDAQITFHADGAGPVTDLVLHQNGKDQTATRMDEAVAKQRADALALKIKNQTPSPGTESELRRHITELIAGTPDFGRMGPELTEATRQALPQIQSLLRPLGALQSLQFKGVGPAGADIYDVKFEHGTVQWKIQLTQDGKIGTSFFGPPQ